MRRSLARAALGAALGALVPAMLVLGPATAAFAKIHTTGGSGTSTTGNDVSYPQCGHMLTAAPAFGIVGLNGGLANNLNPCLGPSASYPDYAQTQLYWAVADATAITTQPKASLYVDTADPGNTYNGAPITDWPTFGATPYGNCATTPVITADGTYTVGADSPACAWRYGYNQASQDLAWLASAASTIDAQAPPVSVPGTAASYPWWLDVESTSTWQTGTSGQAMNVADLQGMVAALRASGAGTVGVYSTAPQWQGVTGGTTSASGSLSGLPDWIPGAQTLTGAKTDCGLPSFTGGRVALAQWPGQSDNDYAC